MPRTSVRTGGQAVVRSDYPTLCTPLSPASSELLLPPSIFRPPVPLTPNHPPLLVRLWPSFLYYNKASHRRQDIFRDPRTAPAAAKVTSGRPSTDDSPSPVRFGWERDGVRVCLSVEPRRSVGWPGQLVVLAAKQQQAAQSGRLLQRLAGPSKRGHSTFPPCSDGHEVAATTPNSGDWFIAERGEKRGQSRMSPFLHLA